MALSSLIPRRRSLLAVDARRPQALAGLGVGHAIFDIPNVEEIAPLQVFGREIIPAVASL